MSGKTRLWILGTAVICGALVIFGLFAGLLPQLSSAASTAGLALSAESQNDVQRTQLAALQAAEKRMPELTRELEELHAAIPDTAESADFVRQLAMLEETTGARVKAFEVKPPVEDRGAADLNAAPAAPAPEADASAEGTSDGSGDAPAAGDVSATAGSTAVGPLAIPIELEIIGSAEQVTAFVRGLQNGERLIEVNGTSIANTPVEAAEGEAAMPDAAAAKVVGRLFTRVK